MDKKNLMLPFNGWSSTVSRLEPRGGSLLFTTVYFFQKFLVLILSTSEGWNAESTLEPPSGFEYGTPGLAGGWLNWHIFIHKLILILPILIYLEVFTVDGGLTIQ